MEILVGEAPLNILGIETSCDETAAAVVRNGREVLSNVVYTQIPLHVPYGGVVPEIASRAHVEKIDSVIRAAIEQANVKIDAVAVTYGPGLAPALIVGLNAAKGLAKSLRVPLIGINHLEAHLHSPFLFDPTDSEFAGRPWQDKIGRALGLVVSGGNTMWVDMPSIGSYNVIGETLDDAAGEAFDKAAKTLGLGYPGGLKIDKISSAWRSQFPEVDVPQELRNAEAWLESHPEKRKKNIRNFLLNWLIRSQKQNSENLKPPIAYNRLDGNTPEVVSEEERSAYDGF